MEAVRQMLRAHCALYPGIQPADCIKLLYQSEMGVGHLLHNPALFENWLEEEICLPDLFEGPGRTPEEVGNRFSRVYLYSLAEGGPSPFTFTLMCLRSAARAQGTQDGLLLKLEVLRTMATAGELPFAAGELLPMLDDYIDAGCPSIHHSARYSALYRPHYRVLDRAAAVFLPVFAAIDRALSQKPHVLVGIDGMSGAGKSSLSAMLQEVYCCGVVHTDDFFLRPEQRGRERLLQAGGNIDYERLAPVAAYATDDRPFEYHAFDCRTGRMGALRRVEGGPITVLEGVYALHPRVAAACDVRVFLGLDAALQAKRIQARSGRELAVRFQREWIPMENRYFSEFGIRESCGVVLNTTALG